MDVCTDYKYLGIVLDNRLRFEQHVTEQCKKAFKKLYYVRTMSKLGVDPDIIVMFFNATIIPTLSYCSIAFYNFLREDLKCKLAKPRKICSRIVRGNDGQLENIDEIHGKSLIKTAIKIVKGGTASSQH